MKVILITLIALTNILNTLTSQTNLSMHPRLLVNAHIRNKLIDLADTIMAAYNRAPNIAGSNPLSISACGQRFCSNGK